MLGIFGAVLLAAFFVVHFGIDTIIAGTVTKGIVGKQDIYLEYQVDSTKTFSRQTATGYNLTLNKIDWVGIDLCQVYGGGVNRTRSVLVQAASDTESDKVQWWIQPHEDGWAITDDLDLSGYEDVTIVLPEGAYFNISNGKTLKLYSPANLVCGPRQQIVSGLGTLDFEKDGDYHVAWRGATGDGSTNDTSAIQTAISEAGTGRLIFQSCTYKVVSTAGTPALSIGASLDVEMPRDAIIADYGVGTTVKIDTGAVEAKAQVNLGVIQSADTTDGTVGVDRPTTMVQFSDARYVSCRIESIIGKATNGLLFYAGAGEINYWNRIDGPYIPANLHGVDYIVPTNGVKFNTAATGYNNDNVIENAITYRCTNHYVVYGNSGTNVLRECAWNAGDNGVIVGDGTYNAEYNAFMNVRGENNTSYSYTFGTTGNYNTVFAKQSGATASVISDSGAGNEVKTATGTVGRSLAAYKTFNGTMNGAGINITDGVTYQWTASGSGTGEYYCEALGGGNPGLADPDHVVMNGTVRSQATLGSLTAGTWNYGDNDVLGWDTIYVRLDDDADPDSKAAGWLRTGEKGLIARLSQGANRHIRVLSGGATDEDGSPDTLYHIILYNVSDETVEYSISNTATSKGYPLKQANYAVVKVYEIRLVCCLVAGGDMMGWMTISMDGE